jgi:excisionase family DNA binding protein
MLLSTREAGRRLHISAVTIHKLVEAGLLRCERSESGLVLIPEEELKKVPITPEIITRLVRQFVQERKAREPKETTHEHSTARP